MTFLPAEQHPWLRDLAWLRRLARTLADEHDAEDAVQDTFVAALRSGPDDEGSRRPWLATVLRNFALRGHRRRASRSARERSVARDESLPSAAALVERVQVQRSVGDAVLALDEPYRRTILLRFFEDLPPRVIARELGVPVNTVRTRIQRGLARLRAQLDREHGGRAAWAALCLPALRDSAAMAGGAGSALAGVMLMSTAHKMTLAVAALLLMAVPVAVWQPWQPAPEAPSRTPEHAVVAAVAAAANADAPVPPPAAREEVQPVAAPDATPRITIMGQLVEERTGQPVASAEVVLAHRHARGRDESRMVSDEAGRFAVEVWKEISARHSLPGDILVAAAGFAPFHQWLPGQEILDATADHFDLGTLRMPRGARVSGRVVREADGVGIAGARLSWTDDAVANGWFMPAEARDAGTSGSDGSFVLSDRLPPTPEWDHTLFAVTGEGLGWASLAIAKDWEHTEVTIKVPDTGILKVHVADTGQQPVSGARVQALPLFPPVGPEQAVQLQRGGGWVGGPPHVQALFVAMTDAEGNAVLPHLAHGHYCVSAMHEDHHPVEQRAKIDRHHQTEVALVMQTVVAVTIHGRVLDTHRQPIANAAVTNRSEGPEATLHTGDDGRFQLGPMKLAGKLSLEVKADGHGPYYQTIDLAKHDAAATVEIMLAPIFTMAGRIVDQDGMPVAGASPYMQRGGRIANKRGTPKTGADGTFSLLVVADADELEMLAISPEPHNRWQPGEPITVRAGDAEVIELRLQRAAPGHATLTVHVTGPDGVTPVEPQQADLHAAAEPFVSIGYDIPVEIASGRVTAHELATGAYELELRHIGSGPVRTTFRVGPDEQDVELHVAIGPPGRIVGRVVFDDVPAELRRGRLFLCVWPHFEGHQLDDDGKPVANLTDGCAHVDAGGDGRFVLGGLPTSSPIEVRLEQHEHLVGAVGFTVPASGEAAVELHLHVGAHVHFTGSGPLPPGRYQLEIATAGEDSRVVSAPQQSAAAPLDVDHMLRPGPFRWRLTGRIANGREAPRPITVEGEATAGRERPLTVTIPIPR